jgi:hypothetical protein
MVQTPLQTRPGHKYDDEWKPSEGNTDDPDNLEESFNAPDAEYPEGHPSRKKSMSDDELADAEDAAGSGSDQGESEAGATDEEKAGLYTKHDKDRPSRFHLSRNKGIAGGIAALLLAGTIGTLSITSGPLKLLHFGQLLKSFHFSNQEDAGSDRMSKIARYIRNRNAPERSRLNLLGNKYADRIEKRFNQAGVESSYNKRGYGDGYVIDPSKVPSGSDLGDIMNRDWGTRDPAAIENNVKDAIARHFDLDVNKVSVNGGVVDIDSSDLGYFKNRRLIKAVMVDAGLDGLGAGMRTRIMGKRAGISWHPMTKLDKKVLDTIDKRLAKWSEDRKKRLTNGDTEIDPGSPRQTEDTNGDGQADSTTPEAEDAHAKTSEIIGEGADANSELKTGSVAPDGAYARLRASTSLKIAGGVSAAIGVVCTLNALADNFDDVRYANLVLPMMRAGMEAITLSQQIMDGGDDLDFEQLGFYADQLYQVASVATNEGRTENIPASSAFSAASVQAEQGKEITGQDIPDETRLDDGENFLTEFFNDVPGLDTTCKATGSIVGQVVTTAIDFVGGPVSATVGLGFGTLIAPQLLDAAVNWLAGDPLNILSRQGGSYGGILNYGARLAANDSYMGAGGRALNGTESVGLKLHRIAAEKERMANMSFSERMFSVRDSGSFVAKVIDANPGTLKGNGQAITQSLASVTSTLSSPLKLAGSIFGSNAYAATEYDYGFPEFGFSVDELNDAAYQNPFDNGDRAVEILSGPNGQQYIDRAEECFGIVINSSGSSIQSTDSPPNYTDVVANSSCTDPSQDWTRVRFYIFDSQMMEAQACYEGDNQSCINIGFAPSPGGANGTTGSADAPEEVDLATLYEPSEDIRCAQGTRDLGVHDGYKSGNLIRIRLCAIDQISSNTTADNSVPNQNDKLAVNSRMSAIYLRLAQDAIAEGITPSANEGYRTMARQEYFYNCYVTKACNDGNLAARPGRSNHQAGVAVDWRPETYNWLSSNGNAQKYGLRVCGCNEQWHYSPDGG